MANDLFGNLGNIGNLGGNLGGALGGIMGGLAKSGLVQTDTPEVKMLTAQAELADMRKKESELLSEIGRAAYERDPGEWPQDSKLRLIRQNIAVAEEELNAVKQAQEQADAKGRCPNCGHKNDEGVKFCQECGASLASAGPKYCISCGAKLDTGTRFCGECGAKQEV
ncbi:MAG: zinc ribbon domain-containing protein [Oscillospiraceae bacterium]|nr:zinc ribbon domain-containing protein [Oscillospiraceae bacterium]